MKEIIGFIHERVSLLFSHTMPTDRLEKRVQRTFSISILKQRRKAQKHILSFYRNKPEKIAFIKLFLLEELMFSFSMNSSSFFNARENSQVINHLD